MWKRSVETLRCHCVPSDNYKFNTLAVSMHTWTKHSKHVTEVKRVWECVSGHDRSNKNRLSDSNTERQNYQTHTGDTWETQLKTQRDMSALPAFITAGDDDDEEQRLSFPQPGSVFEDLKLWVAVDLSVEQRHKLMWPVQTDFSHSFSPSRQMSWSSPHLLAEFLDGESVLWSVSFPWENQQSSEDLNRWWFTAGTTESIYTAHDAINHNKIICTLIYSSCPCSS